MRVLIGPAGGDHAVAQAVTPWLEQAGHQVTRWTIGGDVVERDIPAAFHLIVLAVGGLSWPRVLERCYAAAELPTTYLVLVGEGFSQVQRQRALQAGAAAFPARTDELLAQVQAVVRMHPLGNGREGLSYLPVTAAWQLDVAGRRLIGDGRTRPLPEHEFALLLYFLQHEGVVLERQRLLDHVWGPETLVLEREVDKYIHRLRQKLERDPGAPRCLLSRYGLGYVFYGIDDGRSRRPPGG